MSEELQNLLEASRRMVETRDLVIADLEREIKEVKTDREFIRGWAVRCQNEMDHQASLADIARTEIRELKAMLNGTCDPCHTCGSTLHHSDLCERDFSIEP
jgi:hypothetical protein